MHRLDIHEAFHMLGSALICFDALQRFCQALKDRRPFKGRVAFQSKPARAAWSHRVARPHRNFWILASGHRSKGQAPRPAD